MDGQNTQTTDTQSGHAVPQGQAPAQPHAQGEHVSTHAPAGQQAGHTHASHEHAQQRPRSFEGKDPNTIYIGKKGVMGYVLAVVTQFNNGSPNVTIKARGNMISRAVDVAEIVRHRFLTSAIVKEIRISTEELESEDGSKSKVSSIEIVLTK